jgi:hypothetical protein
VFGFIKKFLNKHRSGLLWVKATGDFRSGNPKDAINSIMEIEKISPLKPAHLAYLGQIYVYDGESETAKPYFLRAMEKTAKMRNLDDRYINMYSRIFVEAMETGELPSGLIAIAQEINCRPSLKRWLPLSSEDTVFKRKHLFGLR